MIIGARTVSKKMDLRRSILVKKMSSIGTIQISVPTGMINVVKPGRMSGKAATRTQNEPDHNENRNIFVKEG
jgi:hypothetical protein